MVRGAYLATLGLMIGSRKSNRWREHSKAPGIHEHYGEVSDSADFSQPIPPVRNERKYVPINEAAMTGARYGTNHATTNATFTRPIATADLVRLRIR